MASDDDNQIMNYVVRMVTPMRREFGRSLNVQQFLHDFAYAREVLDEAAKSQDPRLQEYAQYIQRRLHGPRIADTPAPPRASATPAKPTAPAAPAAAVPAAAPPAGPTEEELRARVLKKYTGGLR
jgi:hypothetical protein